MVKGWQGAFQDVVPGLDMWVVLAVVQYPPVHAKEHLNSFARDCHLDDKEAPLGILRTPTHPALRAGALERSHVRIEVAKEM